MTYILKKIKNKIKKLNQIKNQLNLILYLTKFNKKRKDNKEIIDKYIFKF